jgi:hypothetical protein
MARARKLTRYLVRVPPERAAEAREALDEATEGQVVETAATSEVVTFEITGGGPGRLEAEREMIEIARQFEGTLERWKLDGLYSPWNRAG